MVERFAHGARFFRAVQNSNLLDRFRHGCKEAVCCEGTIEVDNEETDLFAFGREKINRFLGRFRTGTHDDNDPFRVRSTIVIKDTVITSRQFVDDIHVVLNSIRNGGKARIAGFAALEEDIRVDGAAAGGWMFRIEGVFAKGLDGIVINVRSQVFVIEGVNLLDFVTRTEAIEEVQERHPAVDGC